jgi:hypothetical protein
MYPTFFALMSLRVQRSGCITRLRHVFDVER